MRYLLVLTATAGLLFLVVTACVVARQPWLMRWDLGVLQLAEAARSPGLTATMQSITVLGSWVVYLIVLMAGLLVARFRGWLYLVVALASLVVAQLVRVGINLAVRLPRPPGAGWLVSAHFYAYPSGHTVAATVGLGLTAWLIWVAYPRFGWVAAGIAVALSLLVGASRVYLGVHWPSDVVGGFLFGLMWVGITVLLVMR